jgi:hypothetical protein
MSEARSLPSSSTQRTAAAVRVRESRGSSLVQAAQSQAMTGMPPEVPVPRKRKWAGDVLCAEWSCSAIE